tara:strand:+ start:703 stop:1662 length:960 start_codon:yes stop_codon:yes gene_type:complete
MNRNSDAFIGGNFCWFTGVVEDINDPEQLGRVRMRAFGYHTESLVDIKTEALPWATVMGPTGSANISGIGTTTHGLVNGSWVVGFFRDGKSAQDPIIMGTVGSSYDEAPSNKTGFSDPSETYPKLQGEEETYVDTNLLARGTNTIIRELDTVSKEPATLYAAVYPNNKVTQTTSGHIIEIDDTPGAERINIRHMSGTFVEIHPNGDVVQSNSNKYQITTGDDNVHITGVCNLTIDSHCNTTIGGDWNINVTGNKNETIGGNVTEDITGNVKESVGGSVTETVSGSVTESISGSQSTSASGVTVNGGGSIGMTAGRIDLN